MHKRISIKNHYHEIQLTTRRSMLAILIISIFVGLLIYRLAYLQIYKNALYTTLSTQNAIDLTPIEPPRGLIYDRNGVLLAENIPVFSLDIIPLQVPDLEKTLAELGKIIEISDNDLSQFKKQLKQHRRFDEIPLKLRLSEQEVARFTENQYQFPGVLIKARLMRYYPYGESFSHVLGYVGRINAKELTEIDPINYSASHYIGKLGIEKFYEKELHGNVGYEEVENDASGKPIRILKKTSGMAGKNLYLTIDSGLQFAAEKAMVDHRGAVVAIQPQTGQVLAMVSEPAYDPNIFVLGISQKDYDELQQSEEKPLFDRALRGLYPIASTIKPYLGLQGLQTGIITPEFTIFDTGIFKLPNSSHVWHDWQRLGHGRVNLQKAITSSCDIYFYQLAAKMGIQNMEQILNEFGFGSLTGIDLDGELPGIIASPAWKLKTRGVHWFPGDTINSSIGQGDMQATPLQLAVAVSSMANHGQRYQPFLLLGEQTPGQTAPLNNLAGQTPALSIPGQTPALSVPGQAYKPHLPIALPPIKLNNDQYWDIVIEAMQNVVNSPQGTANHLFGRNYNYTIAAKTGTGALSKRRNPDEEDKQESMPEKLRDHHLFIAFAPVDNPQIALAIVTENSNNAIETARAILDYYLGNQQHVDQQPQKQNGT
jgi:penicillin-binding protein 2